MVFTKSPTGKKHISTSVLVKNAGFECTCPWRQILSNSAICWLSKFGQVTPVKWFSKSGPQTSSITLSQDLLEMKILRSFSTAGESETGSGEQQFFYYTYLQPAWLIFTYLSASPFLFGKLLKCTVITVSFL